MKITVKTFENGEITFSLDQLHHLVFNSIQIKPDYVSWLDNGELKVNEYLLHPESLRELIDLIRQNKLEKKYAVHTAEAFLKRYPTYEKLKKSLVDNAKLPND